MPAGTEDSAATNDDGNAELHRMPAVIYKAKHRRPRRPAMFSLCRLCRRGFRRLRLRDDAGFQDRVALESALDHDGDGARRGAGRRRDLCGDAARLSAGAVAGDAANSVR